MNDDSLLVPAKEDVLIVELDDRLEFSHVMPMGDVCGNNGVCGCSNNDGACGNVACGG
jgi:hypothetical protein